MSQFCSFRKGNPIPLHRSPVRVLLGLLAFVFSASALGAPTTLYVATNGNDAWAGTLSSPNSTNTNGPLRTFEGAKARLRQLRTQNLLSSQGAVVQFLPGRYAMSATLTLGTTDSGTATGPIIFRSQTPRGAVFDGGKPISGWAKASDPGMMSRFNPAAAPYIYELSLSAAGVSNAGTMKPRGAWQTMGAAPLELVQNGSPARLAAWPNTGWAKVNAKVDAAVFQSDAARPASWRSLSDVWVQGYFGNHWADHTIALAGYDRALGLVTLASAPPYNIKAKMRYRFVNVPEELDAPGEYYVDRAGGKLYYRSLDSGTPTNTEVTLLEGVFVQFVQASNITLEGFVFKNSRAGGIVGYTCSNLNFLNLAMQNLGHRAITMTGSNLKIQACDIRDTGYGGIFLSGGNRATLTSSNNQVLNNQIYRGGRLVQTGEAGIQVEGVGARIANNAIYDQPEFGVIFSGNDHVVERNEIFNVCKETGDTGAVYAGRDLTFHGNVVRDNLFRRLLALQDATASVHRVTGVYLDDFVSGISVTGNVFVDCYNGVQNGGGSDNVIRNNMMLRCTYSMVLDSRGLLWAAASVLPGGAVYNRLYVYDVTKAPWTKYPNLPLYPTEDLRYAKRNLVSTNVLLDSPAPTNSANKFSLTLNSVTNNALDTVACLRDPLHWDFSILTGTAASQIGFTPVNLNTMGLQVDSYRLSIPNLRGN